MAPLRCPTCKTAFSRQRAAALYATRRDDPELKKRRAEASKRRYDLVAADPDLRARQYARTADWRIRNPERAAETARAYRIANAVKVAEKNRRRRARLLNAWDEDVDVFALLDATGGNCGICGDLIDTGLAWPDKRSLTLDHIVPLSRDGRHSAANCQPAHAVCNSRKNNR